MNVMRLDDHTESVVVTEAVKVLEQGGMIVYPTETVYGIGVDATQPEAVSRLLTYKARREGKPLSIAVDGVDMAEAYVEVNATARNLYTHFLPGPLTVVSKSRGKVARGVASELGTVGVRIPDYQLIRSIISGLGKPIIATSANASYMRRPYSIDSIFESISAKQKNLIDLVIDAGVLPKRDPSTVVDTTLHQEIVLRQGDLRVNKVGSFKTNSPEETRKIGADLVTKYLHLFGVKSLIFALQGEMGAGKTEMTKGIASALAITEAIQSPTFIIEREYSIPSSEIIKSASKKPKLLHIDTWRLFDQQELIDVRFIEDVAEGNVFVVEWADRIVKLLEQVSEDSVIVWVTLEYGDTETSRTITVGDYV